MLRSIMLGNAAASFLFLCFSIYAISFSLDAQVVEPPSILGQRDRELIQQETNIESLRKQLLFHLELDDRRRKSDAAVMSAFRRIGHESAAALALFSCLLLASNAFALKRALRENDKSQGPAQNAL